MLENTSIQLNNSKLKQKMKQLTQEHIDNHLRAMVSMSETTSYVDPAILTELKSLIGKPKEEIVVPLVDIIKRCEKDGQLASKFALQTFHIFHEIVLDGNEEDFDD